MKSVFVFLLFFLSFTVLHAQDNEQETLVNGFRITSSGGYGGPSLRSSTINGDFALLFGGYGGWYVNKKWMIGGGGYGLVTQLKVPASESAIPNEALHYDMGYGGLMVEYIFRSDRMLHLTTHMLVGGGGITQDLEGTPDLTDTHSNFFVFEPGAGLELNITDFFRLNGGLTYRLVSGSDTPGIQDRDLSSMAVFLNFKFGYFN
uniref:Outer membrane beta-barrel protein n=1 Tax=Roseihalotalea indica TaxID=2867963 RepID=A0AA49JHA6_9BACT|nr:outer membrane beta-barrel protein [Tunicatimonas sp. TK19036]